MRNINKIKLYINMNDKSIEVGKKLEDELIRNGFTLVEEDADLNPDTPSPIFTLARAVQFLNAPLPTVPVLLRVTCVR